MISCTCVGTLGRLGNSLFQIASTLGIAERNNTNAFFSEWKYAKYFRNPLPVGFVKAERLDEKQYHFDERLFHLNNTKNYNLIGFFQSEKYWNKEKILKQFEFTDELKNKVSFKHRNALKGNTVAISVRRGDFVNNSNYFQLPITYYLNAYYKYFKGYNIIVFTDDFKYCKLHFKSLPNVHYADVSDIEQLCLMSMCENHIISNSTFSWWGAYLSQSKNVIRPEKNLAGQLAKTCSEQDYWPTEWTSFNQYKTDLTDTTFIIPAYYDHTDRRQNMMLTLSFLNTYFDTNIIIGEHGGEAFKDLSDYADYVQFDLPFFHRTKMINEMAKQAKTPVIVNWDCDNMCTPVQIIEAVHAIRNGKDVAYPFDGTVYRVPRYLFSKVAESLDVESIPENMCQRKCSSVGHAVFLNKESFIACGMENEYFKSWGPEDNERFNRYKILGLTVERITGGIYHMDHFCGENSSTRNKYFADNEKEYFKVISKNKDQLRAEVKTWQWIKEYAS